MIITTIMAFAAIAMSSSSITWNNTTLDIGEVKKGQEVSLSFTFENTGTVPVKILEAKGSCGCTAVTFSEEDVQPGATAKILASFRSEKEGAFNKTVTVRVSNQLEPTVLTFKGQVRD